jgi:hypothetical protein
MQAGALKRDSGTISSNVASIAGRNVMRDGQVVTIYDGVIWTLTGKRGTLTFATGTSGLKSRRVRTPSASALGRSCAVPVSTPESVGTGAMAAQASVTRGMHATRAS